MMRNDEFRLRALLQTLVVTALRLAQRPTILALALVLALAASGSLAHAKGATCQEAFDPIGKIEVNAPGEPDLGAAIGRDARIIAKVAAKLGLAVPAHQLNLVPSGQLDILAGTGAHAAPHAQAGAELLRASRTTMGVLEFVTPGCPTCRGYYSASTPHKEQRSIIMHVAGHNDMSATSRYQLIRPSDAPLASHQLAVTLGKAYRDVGHDQVALYYQWVQSLSGLQDYALGSFDDPSKFSQKTAQVPFVQPKKKTFWEMIQNGDVNGFEDVMKAAKSEQDKAESNVAWRRTTSVLQAMTELLPPEAKPHERDILKLYEQVQRPYPAIFQTKIMNEGWATMQMYLIARYLPWTDSADLVAYAQLLSGVVGRMNFENPYWLGSSGWWNLYEQFMERPEIKPLEPLERDIRFVAYARELYADKNDSRWARIALDQRWIEKNRFFLYRPTDRSELDPNQPMEKQKFIALTRNWKRIQNYVISRYVDIKYLFRPSLSLQNPALTQGYITLRQESRELGLSLDLVSAAKTLFAISQVMKRPVRVEAIFDRIGQPGSSMAQMTVEVNGKVRFKWLEEPIQRFGARGSQEPRTAFTGVPAEADLASALEKKIDEYKTNVIGSYNVDLADKQMQEWERLAAKVGDENSKNTYNIVQFAPHTGPAIREYLHAVESRLMGEVLKMLQGKTTGKIGKKGITLPVLPEVPQFRYSSLSMAQKERSYPKAPVDRRLQPSLDFNADTFGSTIGVGPHMPGDKFGPKQQEGKGKGKGQGQGKGEGDGEPSDEPGDDGDPDDDGDIEMPGEEPGDGSGGGAGSPHEVTIPLQLYGELLSQFIELPNLRRTRGQMAELQRIRRGSLNKPNGYINWDKTLINAIEKARALRRARGLPYDASVPMNELVREAIPLIERSDIIVSGHMEKPLPDTEAVLVVAVDMTGSMSGERVAVAKNLIYNMKALLTARHKKVKIRYIIFDSEAQEVSEQEVFSKFLGGGTRYKAASEKAKEIFDTLDNAKVSKYLMTIGDGETADSDAQAYANDVAEMSPDLQYAALAVTNESEQRAATIINAHLAIKGEWPWVGVTRLSQRAEILRALQDLFPKGGPKDD